MPIPNADNAYVPQDKWTDYLLSEQHPVGGGKAKWFRSLGYEASDPTALEQDLRKLVHTSDDYTAKASAFGTKYVVSGKITSPGGDAVNLTTVWIVEPFDDRPRLVTAYPGEKS